MRLARLGLAIVISLVLMGLVCPVVQADDNKAEVDLSATVALTISDVSAYNIGYYSATISWNTNGNATSQVFYDTESRASPEDYANSTTEETTRVTEHSVSLTGLSSSTTYHYRVRSAIPDTKFIVISEDYTFRTLTPPPPPPAVGGAGPPPIYYIRTNLFGIEERYRISYSGKILETIEAVSEDGILAIFIPRGTIALDKDGRRLKSLGVLVDETPPPPPEDTYIIGLAYDFGLDGATFAPPIELLIHYDPKELPENVSSIFVAYYDEQQGWIQLEPISGFVAAVGIVTAEVSHFTTFAIIAAVAPPPPPVPAAFSVSNLTVQPPEVEPGEAVTITVSVANTGGSEGSYSVVLRINGAVEATKEVTIHAGFSKEVTFTISKDIAGTYSVDVDGLTGSFRVKEVPAPVAPPVAPPTAPPPRVNWAILGPIIGVAVFLAIFLPIRMRRRRASK